MKDLIFACNYRNDEQLREHFNHLAKTIFQVDFSEWCNKGYWTEKYVPFSYVNDEGEVIANASIFKMTIDVNDKTYYAIQIGTVMTDTRYRNKGLAKALISKIIDAYKDKCDFIYLFANESVLDFYPKFGFSRLDESEYSLWIQGSNLKVVGNAVLEKLSVEHDIEILENYAKNRHLNKVNVVVRDNAELLMFYFIVVFPEHIYYIPELETIVLMKHEEASLHIFDIISLKEQQFPFSE